MYRDIALREYAPRRSVFVVGFAPESRIHDEGSGFARTRKADIGQPLIRHQIYDL